MQTGVSPVLCVKESIVATLQLLRIVFPRFRAKERKKESLPFRNFRIFSLNFVYCNNKEDITT